MKIDEIKQQIVDVVKKEYQFGMVNMFEGNVSARMGDRYFITPSQVAKETMTSAMIIEVDREGCVVDGPKDSKPSSEVMMHLEVYKLRPDVQAVVHNHSIYATAFAMNGMPICSDSLTEMNVTFGEIPVVPYGTPGSDGIYKHFDQYLKNHCAILLENHGLLAIGPDLERAYSFAEAAEKVAQTIFIARKLGTESKIPAEELEGLRQFGEQMRIKEIQDSLSK